MEKGKGRRELTASWKEMLFFFYLTLPSSCSSLLLCINEFSIKKFNRKDCSYSEHYICTNV